MTEPDDEPPLRIWPAVGEEEAVRLLSRRRRFFSKKPIQEMVELVYLPCRRVGREFALGRDRFQVVVDGFARSAHLAPAGEPLVGRPERARLPRPDEVPEVTFPYPLRDSETVEIASQSIVEWKLNRMLPPGVEIGEPAVGPVIEYPYWVYYEEDQERHLKFRLLDAVSGRMADQAVRLGFIEALRDRD